VISLVSWHQRIC